MGKPWCKIYMFIVSGNIGIFTMLFILFACFVFNVYIYNIFRILCIYSACQWIELWIIQVFLGCYNFQSKCWSWIALRLVSTISPWKPNRSDPDGLTSGNCHLQVSLAKFKDLSLRIVILQLVGYLTSWVGQPNGSSNIIWVCPNSGVPHCIQWLVPHCFSSFNLCDLGSPTLDWWPTSMRARDHVSSSVIQESQTWQRRYPPRCAQDLILECYAPTTFNISR